MLYVVAVGATIFLALSVTIAYQLGSRARVAPLMPSGPSMPAIQPDARKPAKPAAPPAPVSRPASDAASTAAAKTRPPVRFTNPFDASEVFEFPPGTTEAEARDAVAALLIKRARQRQTVLNWHSYNPSDQPKSLPAPALAQRN